MNLFSAAAAKIQGMHLFFLLATFISGELMSYHIIAITSVQLWSDILCFIPLQQITQFPWGKICGGKGLRKKLKEDL